VCNPPFKGRQCDIKRCPNDCSGHGACDEQTAKCLCFKGWGGKNCGGRPYSQAWAYSGGQGQVGPNGWGTLSSHYQTCANGKFQSPIRLPYSAKDGGMDAFYHNITFGYQVSEGFNMIDNGRFLTAELPHGSFALFGEHRYELKNITMRTPAEHALGTNHYAMEMQLHHEDDFGNLASIAILFEAADDTTGNFNAKYGRSDFWRGYVANKGVTKGDYLNLAPYLPNKTKSELHFYSYPGSQTYPPCMEGVQWFVMKKVHQVRTSDVDNLMRQFSSNARSQQASLGRAISFF
jgi:carbonic anhydrase